MSEGPARRPVDRAALVRLVQRAVTCRFALGEEAFAEVVAERAGALAPSQDPVEYAGGLSLDDLYLATACLHGDDQAWRECRDRFFEYIGAFARRFLADTAAIEIRDQVFAELWQRKRFAQYDGRSSLRTWLGALVAHAAINARRVEGRAATLDRTMRHDASTVAATAGEDSTDARENRRAFASLVERGLAALDADGKLLLLLYYEQGLTLEEMSAVLSASKATLSRRLARVRGDLHRAIEDLAQHELAMPAAELAEGLDFARLELDLSVALAGDRVKLRRGGSV